MLYINNCTAQTILATSISHNAEINMNTPLFMCLLVWTIGAPTREKLLCSILYFVLAVMYELTLTHIKGSSIAFADCYNALEVCDPDMPEMEYGELWRHVYELNAMTFYIHVTYTFMITLVISINCTKSPVTSLFISFILAKIGLWVSVPTYVIMKMINWRHSMNHP